jgi:hypothetical protein
MVGPARILRHFGKERRGRFKSRAVIAPNRATGSKYTQGVGECRKRGYRPGAPLTDWTSWTGAPAAEIELAKVGLTIILRRQIVIFRKTGWGRVVRLLKYEEASRMAQEFGRAKQRTLAFPFSTLPSWSWLRRCAKSSSGWTGYQYYFGNLTSLCSTVLASAAQIHECESGGIWRHKCTRCFDGGF